mmetsp:Transcript_4432/g.4893  ORF Transcript_4432/g.4893 Transcript_4432/m.4893 type:complete len:201 (+) Transcript_4432:77-679(+)
MCYQVIKATSDDELSSSSACADDRHDTIVQNDNEICIRIPLDNSCDDPPCYDAKAKISCSKYDQKSKKKVSFGYVAIRLYPVMMGDNPACERGVPITIGETCIQEVVYRHVDCHHYHRGERRIGTQLRLSSSRRRNILMREAKCSKQDIAKRIIEVRTIQDEREESIRLYRWNGLKFILESSIQKLKVMSNSSTKKITNC